MTPGDLVVTPAGQLAQILRVDRLAAEIIHGDDSISLVAVDDLRRWSPGDHGQVEGEPCGTVAP